MEHIAEYDLWNLEKMRLESLEGGRYFKEGEVWWCQVGLNIGSEMYGKGKRFLRPVLVLRKISAFAFIGIPATSRLKTGDWFVRSNVGGKPGSFILPQVRLFSTKRCLDRISTLTEGEFETVKTSFIGLFQ